MKPVIVTAILIIVWTIGLAPIMGCNPKATDATKGTDPTPPEPDPPAQKASFWKNNSSNNFAIETRDGRRATITITYNSGTERRSDRTRRCASDGDKIRLSSATCRGQSVDFEYMKNVEKSIPELPILFAPVELNQSFVISGSKKYPDLNGARITVQISQIGDAKVRWSYRVEKDSETRTSYYDAGEDGPYFVSEEEGTGRRTGTTCLFAPSEIQFAPDCTFVFAR